MGKEELQSYNDRIKQNLSDVSELSNLLFC